MDRIDRLLVIAQLLQLTPEQLRERATGLKDAPPLPQGWQSATDGLRFHAQMAAALAPLRAEFVDDARWLSLGQLLAEGVEVQEAARRVRAGWRRAGVDATRDHEVEEDAHGGDAPVGSGPPGPWAWRQVVPEQADGSAELAGRRGEALVASDGTWLVWAESGYVAPAVHPAVKELLARAWQLRPEPAPSRFAFEADLHWEDDDGNNMTLLARADFDPTVVYPGAVVRVGRPGAGAEVEVLGTQLRLGSGSAELVLVTFRQTALRTREAALGAG